MESLFNSLRKYRPRENTDPIENFLTEAFAWLLKSESQFSSYFLKRLDVTQDLGFDKFTSASWSTQCNWNGFFPDMVCELTDHGFAYVFEHKVWSYLHPGQLKNYKNYAKENYGENFRIILITAHSAQHEQFPDEALCWRNIYRVIEDYLKESGGASCIAFLFRDFLELLRECGLAPHGAFRVEEIVGYSTDFRHRMNLLWQEISEELKIVLGNWAGSPLDEIEDYCVVKNEDQWGRIGLSLFREWRPNLFLGALLDTGEHNVTYSDPAKGPDCCFILCYDSTFHQAYNEPTYQALVVKLERLFADQPGGWSLYNHLLDDRFEEKNMYHPLYIRKPLLEVLSTGQAEASLQEQASAIVRDVIVPLKKILCETSLIEFRELPESKNRVVLTPDLLFHRLVGLIGKNRNDVTAQVLFDRRTPYLHVCTPEGKSGILGFNIYDEDTRYAAWFFSNPIQSKEDMTKLVESNNARFQADQDQHQIFARFGKTDKNEMREAVNIIDQCMRALGDEGLMVAN